MNSHFFKDKSGTVVLAQAPNLPLFGWLVLEVAHHFVHSLILSWFATILLLIWAVLEVWLGVNYFRRLLGLTVLIALLVSHFTIL